ncbi:AAA family ATPase [Solirubrobacter soli]|uniref:AAA family ATPase n=1 Tax=Solirubrobacter soli TaxID=363832 RepID=UPI0004052D08|nr:ATP-binding protein [Solirubrobacter soli]
MTVAIESTFDAELDRLDDVLAAAVVRQRAEGRWQGDDELRGVYVSPELAAATLAGRHAFTGEASSEDGPLASIGERFALDRFERFALLLALAPEVDSRYRPALALLTDDPGRGAPTVALAIDLYAGAGPHSAHLRAAFAPAAPLVRNRLLRVTPPPVGRSLMQHVLEVDEWVVARVAGFDVPDAVAEVSRVEAGGAEGAPLSAPTVLVSEDRRAALDAARALAPSWLILDADDEESLFVAARRARLDGHGLAVAAAAVNDAERALSGLAHSGLRVAVTATPAEADRLPDEWPRRRVPAIGVDARRRRWEQALDLAGLAVPADEVELVARSHPMALDRIDAAAARLAADEPAAARTGADLRAAARSVARHGLDALASRVRRGRSWDDLVLPASAMRRLRDIAAAAAQRPRVLDEWGFANGGRGLHVLFSGPSGTGKTLAASVIADAVGYELYAIDLSRVVDKYLGETEKHLDRVFGEAEKAGAVLLFDEADALFGRRAEVHDARDRYANVEIAYLLQRLESHDGLTILATNLVHHLDAAFARRLHQRVDFVVPDAALRRRLWRTLLPAAAPVAADLDLDLLAERFELAGGAIRNAALTAAYLAASDGRPISLRDAVRAIARELEKSGGAATRADLRELHELVE